MVWANTIDITALVSRLPTLAIDIGGLAMGEEKAAEHYVGYGTTEHSKSLIDRLLPSCHHTAIWILWVVAVQPPSLPEVVELVSSSESCVMTSITMLSSSSRLSRSSLRDSDLSPLTFLCPKEEVESTDSGLE